MITELQSTTTADLALDAAPANGWTVIDIRNDWKVIFPLEKK
jgi:hypothetical protein